LLRLDPNDPVCADESHVQGRVRDWGLGGFGVTNVVRLPGLCVAIGAGTRGSVDVIRGHREVLGAEEDCIASIPTPQPRDVQMAAQPPSGGGQPVQPSYLPDWGQRRSDQRGATFDPAAPIGPLANAANTHVWIFDTGILPNHQELYPRVRDERNFVTGEQFVDNNGHGTHCSGIAAGIFAGYAKAATIHNMKVLNSAGSGSYSAIITAIGDAVNRAASISGAHVFSMSLGGPFSQALNDAVNSAVAQNIPVIVAAGNDASDAANYSPSSASGAIAVGATDRTGLLASYSNFGTLVNVLAPGTDIISSFINRRSTTTYAKLSGTSMATPAVAGQVALFAAIKAQLSGQAVARVSTQEVRDAIANYATPNVINLNGKTVGSNSLVYDRWNAANAVPNPPPP